MYYGQIAEMQLRIEHRHDDGSWAEMLEDESPHDPAAHDPERSWGRRRLFRCTRCDETVLVGPEEQEPPADAG
jgi:hypothetical protein